MPQMAPIMWTSLFIMFSSLFIFSVVKIYFSKKISTLTPKNSLKINSTEKLLNWKW